MKLEYIHSDGRKELINIDEKYLAGEEWEHFSSVNKLEFIKKFIPRFKSGQRLILFDNHHKQLLNFYKEHNINDFDGIKEVSLTQQLLFFTSGSSGFPLGAFKSRENLDAEVSVLVQSLEKYKIKKVVVTVPFVHIYGVLVGLLLPMKMGVSLVIKEDFLPYELLEEAKSGHTLIVTTPVFIKALSRLTESLRMPNNVFISSTGPLHKDDVISFEKKFSTNLMQLFGSTETGGIASKLHANESWKTLNKVKISTNEDKLQVSSPFISKYLLDKEIKKIDTMFQTQDIVEINEEGFVLLGRSNKIIKIAGKRISSALLETTLETLPNVEVAVVELVYKKELLRSEQVLITLQAKEHISQQAIKDKISECYGVLTIPFKLVYVEKIKHSAMGKKILF